MKNTQEITLWDLEERLKNNNEFREVPSTVSLPLGELLLQSKGYTSLFEYFSFYSHENPLLESAYSREIKLPLDKQKNHFEEMLNSGKYQHCNLDEVQFSDNGVLLLNLKNVNKSLSGIPSMKHILVGEKDEWIVTLKREIYQKQFQDPGFDLYSIPLND